MLIRISWNSEVRNLGSDRMNSAIASQNLTQIQLGVLAFNIHESADKNLSYIFGKWKTSKPSDIPL